MQGSHGFRADGAVFDEENLVSHAGLVPVLELAEQCRCRKCRPSRSGGVSVFVEDAAESITSVDVEAVESA